MNQDHSFTHHPNDATNSTVAAVISILCTAKV